MTTYCRKVNGELVYPFTALDLRNLFPNISMPKKITEKTFLKFNAHPVHVEPRPEIDNRTQKIIVGDYPEWVEDEEGNGCYKIVQSVVEKTEEEIEAGNEAEASQVRDTRNKLLQATDFYALSDVQMPESVETYRQALRDITSHSNFPYLAPEDWPTLEVV